MKRTIAGFVVVAVIALLIGSAAVWHQYFRRPPVEPMPLPDRLISLRSTEGKKLLGESDAVADYQDLIANFVPQSRRAYCGVASAVVAVNAMREAPSRLSQATFFDRPSIGRTDSWKTSFIGMSLQEFGEALRAHGTQATVVYASDTDLESFRRTARANLSTPGDLLLVNYQRKHIGQDDSGHISPVAAYHAGSDRILILDVAAHKYPPVWVEVEALWEAMNAPLNSETELTRGFVVVD